MKQDNSCMPSELEQAKSQSDQFDASRVPIDAIHDLSGSAYSAHTQQTMLRRSDYGEIFSYRNYRSKRGRETLHDRHLSSEIRNEYALPLQAGSKLNLGVLRQQSNVPCGLHKPTKAI
jgi:hypothetical protein